jgi:hypothetical protein
MGFPPGVMGAFTFHAVGKHELWELAQKQVAQNLGPPVPKRHLASILGFGQEIRPRGGDALRDALNWNFVHKLKGSMDSRTDS